MKKRAGLLAFLIDDLGAEVDEDFRDIDFDRANLVAGAAERGGVGERLRVVHLRELRSEDGADGAGIDGTRRRVRRSDGRDGAGKLMQAAQRMHLRVWRSVLRRPRMDERLVVEQDDVEVLRGRRLE